jgi:hypothetical protein
VALLAGHARVLVLECPTGARVIEALRAALWPFDESEVSSCMIRMTGGAVGPSDAGMQAAILLREPRDFTMT